MSQFKRLQTIANRLYAIVIFHKGKHFIKIGGYIQIIVQYGSKKNYQQTLYSNHHVHVTFETSFPNNANDGENNIGTKMDLSDANFHKIFRLTMCHIKYCFTFSFVHMYTLDVRGGRLWTVLVICTRLTFTRDQGKQSSVQLLLLYLFLEISDINWANELNKRNILHVKIEIYSQF